MRAAAAFLTLAIAGHAIAEEESGAIRLDAEAFRALTEGRSAHFAAGGELYGSEGYFPDDRSIWRDSEGDCQEGEWWEEAQSLCFRYQTISCWQVFRGPEGEYYAVADDTGLRVDFIGFHDGPLECKAPFV